MDQQRCYRSVRIPLNLLLAEPTDDRTFSIELTHPSFNQAIAIANNVDPTLDQVTVELPIVPGEDQYTLEFVNITNINQIFATSAQFSIAAAASPSLSATSAISTTPPSVSVPVVGTSTPVATSSGAFPSVTTPLIPTTAAATTSQSLSGAAISTASAPSTSPSTTQSASSSLAPFPGSAIHVIMALGTILCTVAWVL
ncbi:hypothetical protein DFH08DRAFT_491667 [Mycena albidolilacea]|uniref:Uncharacterized protein n=1 Tax=Mycena albidolilacea TaxID=1033008 RepID=A0AAD6Z511_9AGAR|nr:hypothetical protein DFH08DRAFT_491667 [Mycena albidolilacea]